MTLWRCRWDNFLAVTAAGAGMLKVVLGMSGPYALGAGIVLGSLIGIERRTGLVLPRKLRYDTVSEDRKGP